MVKYYFCFFNRSKWQCGVPRSIAVAASHYLMSTSFIAVTANIDSGAHVIIERGVARPTHPAWYSNDDGVAKTVNDDIASSVAQAVK